MKSISYLASTLTVCFMLLGPASHAEEPVKDNSGKRYDLAYQFNMGDVVRYQIDHRASVRSTIEGTTQTAVTRSESVKAWKVIDVLENGEIEFVHVVERVRMTNRLPDRAEMIYDSKTDRNPPPGFEDAAEAVGVPLSVIRMTSRGELVEREVKHHQPAADTEAPITLLLPEEPIAVGDTWNEPRTVNVQTQDGAARDIKCRRHYKLLEVKDGIASIEVSYQILTPVDPTVQSQLVQRLMKGVAKFDIERGRIVGQQMDVNERVLGFAGPTSSMHYVMKMTEEELSDKDELASKPAAEQR